MKINTDYHIPVMLQPCLEGLALQANGIYVDVTFGGGGHSRAIFEQLSPKGKLVVFDQDPDALNNTWEAPNFHFVPANFAFLRNHLRALGMPPSGFLLISLIPHSAVLASAKTHL